ncbi:LysR family transcriptional regulator ArgP [Microbacterium sediminis]|uniref:Transcriptional regulator ArgP n=1 Tax=Microbacterium sediminis TaxID=904291 RepID=A0A1B9N7V4_9MICO|nr:LysR family transcriptional regulator ArgP [Microbacterium sediminis]OCG72679.1 transcriptional regulator ArgP [Microbacterium sediminis]QBR74808.1 LysR family transcriptional regulator ArgP [Microbacterium sediminis]
MRIAPELAETVAAVVDAGSFELAAVDLRISPSAVSQRLRALESELGQVLVVRSRPVRATEAGEAVVRLARQYAVLEHDAARELGLGGARVQLPLAVNADSLATWIIGPLADFAARHPVDVELLRDDQDATADMLASGTAIGAVTSQAEPLAGCVVVPLGRMRYVASATPAYLERWLPDGATAEALASAPVIEFDRRDDLQSRWLAARGVDPSRPPRHYIPGSQDFVRAVQAGMGWGLVPVQMPGDGLVRIHDDEETVPLFWQRRHLRSPLLEELDAALVAAAAAALQR